MISLTLNEIARIVHGTVLNATGAELVTAPAFIDSRVIIAGGIFVAFEGQRADGHAFAAEAVRGGAAAAIVSRDVGVRCVRVADPGLAVQRLAAYVRTSLPNLKVIGITGSQGKTTTKDLLFAILSAVAPTIAPVGSLNNELGVPLTLLRCSENTRYCILEMGARHQGDIAKLASLAAINVGAVLNIGSAHVGEFGSHANLARTKGELISALKSNGVAILGTYDSSTIELSEIALCPVTTFGETAQSDIRGEDVSLTDGLPRFRLVRGNESVEVRLKYYGRHQVANALAAAAMAVELGVEVSKIAELLSADTPSSRWRMEVKQRERDGVTVINDSYNANPESMTAAINLLGEWATIAKRPSWAILGQMHELGASSDEAHRLIGRLVAQRGIEHLLVVGSSAREILNGAREMAMADAEIVLDSGAALDFLRARVEPGALILVKASRAEGLEELALEIAGASA